MAPGGQRALVDVCKGKAHPQRPVGPGLGHISPGAGLGLGGTATRGWLDPGAPDMLGLGRPQRLSHLKGELGPREGRALARAAQQVHGVKCAYAWGRGRNGELSGGDRPRAGTPPRTGALQAASVP